jgi:hypothetical protein
VQHLCKVVLGPPKIITHLLLLLPLLRLLMMTTTRMPPQLLTPLLLLMPLHVDAHHAGRDRAAQCVQPVGEQRGWPGRRLHAEVYRDKQPAGLRDPR